MYILVHPIFWFLNQVKRKEPLRGVMTESTEADSKRYLYNDIVDRIQQMIRSGELKVGNHLPPERDLARTYRVSRHCIRQAIQTLSEKGILESRRGAGTYLCPPNQSLLVKSFAQAIQVDKGLLREIFEFRLLMEPQFAYLAARNISREELDRLKVIVCDQERRALADQKDSDLDAAFHYELAKATKNRVILEVLNTINHVLNESRSEFLQSDVRKRASVIGHLRVIDALEEGNSEQAFSAMHEHLLAIKQTVLGYDAPRDQHARDPS
ncbi:MAG TPA: FadR family transcriptional regulator [Syntrophobacteraceae bacterium]|nr:FadR family transcriptional regulator [Syntrophobacteraceae bacterium]